MQIFSDVHHFGLFHSLQLLFEKRLGYQIFRPIGMEWYEQGFWAVYPSLDTAKQYLSLEQGYLPKDGTVPLNDVTDTIDGVYYCQDHHHLTYNKAITLDKFKEMDIDIVIASLPQHIKPFKELAKMKNAKFIFQMGNMFTEVINNLHEIPNLLASVKPFTVPSTTNVIFYHQEFETDIFKPSSIPPEKKIVCFMNVLKEYPEAHEIFYSLKSMLPEFEFRSYGGQCEDGSIVGIDKMAGIMQQSFCGFCFKPYGDGFGHVLYNWYACGKPVITRFLDYKDKLGAELLEDQETAIFLDNYDLNRVVSMIRDIDQQKYDYMSQQAYKRFTNCVNYQEEFIRIKFFLENLR